MPAGVEDFVRMCTSSYGKVKLVLKQNKYFLETAHLDVLQCLLKDPVLAGARFIKLSKYFKIIMIHSKID